MFATDGSLPDSSSLRVGHSLLRDPTAAVTGLPATRQRPRGPTRHGEFPLAPGRDIGRCPRVSYQELN